MRHALAPDLTILAAPPLISPNKFLIRSFLSSQALASWLAWRRGVLGAAWRSRIPWRPPRA